MAVWVASLGLTVKVSALTLFEIFVSVFVELILRSINY